MTRYLLKDYRYHLPAELIAQQPLSQRDTSRMMILERGKGCHHSQFKKLPQYLSSGDLLVFNNSRVIPARLQGYIVGSRVECECLLIKKIDSNCWLAMVKPGKKLKAGTEILLESAVKGVIEDYADHGMRVIRFFTEQPLEKILKQIGAVPLPPYITNQNITPEQYQTIYASVDGSAAAPTAGFHFTPAIFASLAEKNIETTFLTLHIGPGTFQPVKTDDIRKHEMHSEYFRLEKDTADKLNETRRKGGRIIAVGTTSCRVLETVVHADGFFEPCEGLSNLFIYPGYKYQVVDALLTNFHLPGSTLIMLVSALAGYEAVMEAYQEAVEERYRFYSFGDCMLIL